ncbi:hypothetical protein E3N88_25236 [Mikania micrantha]|uniref:MHD domain-containing protein n=1 Tax=Mikania micrantha TaxID=192012 RepID=A0A5N6N704_9ASTR|nr:hypothetical protein E3N88_25236 [Mikania micrantha]
MDIGYPQNLSPEILKLYITQGGVQSPFSSKRSLHTDSHQSEPILTFLLNLSIWSPLFLSNFWLQGFLDIVESVDLLMSSKGSVLRCDVTGIVLMKCFLLGMPDLKMGLNGKIGLEKQSQFKSRPTKRYRITEGVTLQFRVMPTIKELGWTRIEVNVKFCMQHIVEVFVDEASSSSYIRSGIELISTIAEKKSWTRPPATNSDKVPMFTASGLRVRFLKVLEKSGYIVEWVRYISKPGSYGIRCKQ